MLNVFHRSLIRCVRFIAAAVTVFTFSIGTASATYPERPVTIVVPFAAGGANDVVVRIIQQPLSEALGQPIIVENRGGAGGNIGFGVVARARPDGYTLLLAPNSFVVNPSLYDKVPYDPLKDFAPVAEISFFPIALAVRPDLGVNTLQDLITRAKAAPGVLNYSTPGPGTLPHLATELIKLRTGIDIVHIPYSGAAPAAQALLGRTVDVAAMSITVANPLIQTGTIKALAGAFESLARLPWLRRACPSATLDKKTVFSCPTAEALEIAAGGGGSAEYIRRPGGNANQRIHMC